MASETLTSKVALAIALNSFGYNNNNDNFYGLVKQAKPSLYYSTIVEYICDKFTHFSIYFHVS